MEAGDVRRGEREGGSSFLLRPLSFPVSAFRFCPRSAPNPVSENLHFNRWSAPPSVALRKEKVRNLKPEPERSGDGPKANLRPEIEDREPKNLKPETGNLR